MDNDTKNALWEIGSLMGFVAAFCFVFALIAFPFAFMHNNRKAEQERCLNIVSQVTAEVLKQNPNDDEVKALTAEQFAQFKALSMVEKRIRFGVEK